MLIRTILREITCCLFSSEHFAFAIHSFYKRSSSYEDGALDFGYEITKFR